MTDHVNEMSLRCAERNETVEECRTLGNITLDEFLQLQADKVIKNSKLSPLVSPDDFYGSTAEYVEKRLGREAGREADEAVRCGVISTSDHHGSLFCAQTFQGDLLFGELLRKLGYTGRHVTIHGGSQVELGNVTYARGFCTYTSAAEKHQVPLFPSKDRQRLSSHTKAVTPEMIELLFSHLDESDEPEFVKDSIGSICTKLWADTGIPESGRYADQTVTAGAKLSSLLFSGGDWPILTYIELEELAAEIIKKELRDSNSLLSHLIFDPKNRAYMQSAAAGGGVSSAGLLFRNVDERGRKSLLTLTENGELTGRGWHGEELKYSANADSLCSLLDERHIFPGLFVIALVLAFERGITWMGGMFQSCYLPEWQNGLVKLLIECGYKSEAGNFSLYDCSGYICGPMFAQYEGEKFTTVAGPLEFYMNKPNWDKLRDMMLGTGLWDAHQIGLTEMYFDLFGPVEREEDWYRKITTELYGRFPNALPKGNK